MSIHRTSYTMIITEYDDKWTVNGWDCSRSEFPSETEAKAYLIDLIKDIPNHKNKPAPLKRREPSRATKCPNDPKHTVVRIRAYPGVWECLECRVDATERLHPLDRL